MDSCRTSDLLPQNSSPTCINLEETVEGCRNIVIIVTETTRMKEEERRRRKKTKGFVVHIILSFKKEKKKSLGIHQKQPYSIKASGGVCV